MQQIPVIQTIKKTRYELITSRQSREMNFTDTGIIHILGRVLLYRVTHLVGKNLPLTYVWEVPVACGPVLYCSHLLHYWPSKMVELKQQEVFADEMGHPMPSGMIKKKMEFQINLPRFGTRRTRRRRWARAPVAIPRPRSSLAGRRRRPPLRRQTPTPPRRCSPGRNEKALR